jgi:hypothetical protein
MEKESKSALKTMLGIGLGGAAGAALGFGPLGKFLVKKSGLPAISAAQIKGAGATLGLGAGGVAGATIANLHDPESLIGADIGSAGGILAGAAAGAPRLFRDAKINPKGALLKYLLSVGGGAALGGGAGAYAGPKLGINDELKSLYEG